MKLTARLFLIVALAALPAILVQLYYERDFRRAREAELHAEALRVAQFLNGEINAVTETARALLVAMANSRSVRTLDRQRCAPYLQAIEKEYPQFFAPTVVAVSGETCAGESVPVGIDPRDRAYFRDALAVGGFVVGEYTFGRPAPTGVLPFSMPFRGLDGEVAGIVVVALDLGWLAERLQRRNLGTGNTLAVVDRSRTILV